jgi:hypothetical protein
MVTLVISFIRNSISKNAAEYVFLFYGAFKRQFIASNTIKHSHEAESVLVGAAVQFGTPLSEFLATDPKAPGSIASATRFSEK